MARRGENIHKRKDGRWEARVLDKDEYGNKKYRSVYGKTYKEVKEKRMDTGLSHQSTKNPDSEILFGDVIDMWLINNFFSQKQSTKLKYQVMIEKHIKPVLGNTVVSSIDENVINHFLVVKMESGRLDQSGGLSCSYVKTMGIIISSVMNYAVSKEYCSPLKTRINKPTVEKKEIEVLTLEMQSALEKRLMCDDSLTALGVLVALNTGLRIGEICALNWEDIDIEDNIIHVRHTVARVKKTEMIYDSSTQLIIDKPKTKSSVRDIPITTKLHDILKKCYENAISGYVVSGSKSFVSPRTFEYRFHRLLEKYNMPNINFHVLRHTFATRCVELNMDAKTLSEILGHANVGITLNTYVHPSFELKRSQMEKLCSI